MGNSLLRRILRYVPVLAGSPAYAIADSRTEVGTWQGVKLAPEFYIVIAVSTLIGMSLNWFVSTRQRLSITQLHQRHICVTFDGTGHRDRE
jgi:hypothetical protein